MLLAANTGHEELALSDEEAKALADAAAKVQRHYPPKINAKMMDWGNLFLCLGTVYGSRGVTLYAKARQSKKPTPVRPPEREQAEIRARVPATAVATPSVAGFDPANPSTHGKLVE